MLSYWEKRELITADLVIVGGGLVGCFAALTYKETNPNARVTIIERGILPSGASTKNAGFACFGSVSELQEDLKDCSLEELVLLTERRFKGIQHLRKVMGDRAIGYEPVKGYELCFEAVNTDLMAFFNRELRAVFGADPFNDQTHALSSYPFSRDIQGLIAHDFEGTLNSGKMMSALHERLGAMGIRYLSGSTLKGFEECGPHIALEVESALQSIPLHTQKMAFCTNAFTSTFFPELDINPGRGMVLVSKPIKGLKLQGSFHYNKGYNYFRAIDNRILLGGARHLDKETTSGQASWPLEKISNPSFKRFQIVSLLRHV
jgi:glycine/D-amino acid oxidase-like deaminating enzyme